MALASATQWTPFGVALNVYIDSASVSRISATQYRVTMGVSWKSYYGAAKTNYGMTAASGGGSVTINPFGTKATSGSGTLVGTYSISGNGSASKSVSVVFTNFNTDNGDSATKTLTITVSVPAWTSYTVSYNANGGSGAPSAQTKWKDQTLTLSSTKPTRTGYTFKGWATSSSGSVSYNPGSSYTSNSSVTLYAVWQINTWTVSYNANGGSGAPGSQTKTYGVTLTLSSTKPTRTGYTFQGWATSASGSVAYASGGSYTSNSAITLYAVWKINTYIVSYNANGGNGAPGSQTKTYGVNLTLSSTKPTRTNYNFMGWATSAAGAVSYAAGGTYTANTAVTLYAVWELAYVIPTISNLRATRCNSDGTVNETGTYYKLEFDWDCCQLTGVNPIASVMYKFGDAASASISVDTSATSGSVSVVLGGSASIENSYTIQVTITDSMAGSRTLSTVLPATHFPIDFKAGGTGVAFGKPAEYDGVADFGYDVKIHNCEITQVEVNGIKALKFSF